MLNFPNFCGPESTDEAQIWQSYSIHVRRSSQEVVRAITWTVGATTCVIAVFEIVVPTMIYFCDVEIWKHQWDAGTWGRVS